MADELARQRQSLLQKISSIQIQRQQQAMVAQRQKEEHEAKTKQLDLQRAELEEQANLQVERQAKLEQKDMEIIKRDKNSQWHQIAIEAKQRFRYRRKTPQELCELKRLAIVKLNIDIMSFNIAISGQSGSGKSTIINELRDLAPMDPNAAKVDINESTQEMTRYPYMDGKDVMLWDCPGAGTTSHPLETYFYDKQLFVFDYLLFIFTERIREEEIDLIKHAIAHNIKFALIRNKANNDLRSKRRTDPMFASLTTDQGIQSIISDHKKAMRESLLLAGVSTSNMPPLFVINSWALTNINEDKFEETALKNYIFEVIAAKEN